MLFGQLGGLFQWGFPNIIFVVQLYKYGTNLPTGQCPVLFSPIPHGHCSRQSEPTSLNLGLLFLLRVALSSLALGQFAPREHSSPPASRWCQPCHCLVPIEFLPQFPLLAQILPWGKLCNTLAARWCHCHCAWCQSIFWFSPFKQFLLEENLNPPPG